ncbi:MAG TPA: FAD-binding oxidoreductase [Thermomicrobiales bacterium]|nr:FAD-binding oxidoreductase [Thermomicrobiales bacterium]
MSAFEIRTREGSITTIDEATVQAFAGKLRGGLLHQDSPGYDEARKLWNGMIDRRPALIARCLGSADVVEAVNFARQHDLLISVRGAGHNIAGTAIVEGGLMIDLFLMKGIRVEPESRRVWVQPGTTWADVDIETQLHGLIVPGGIVSTTGVSGFTLGGGFGWLTRKWGYTPDLLRSVEIVTADGQLRNVSAESESDLFWALSGGGGNFGVVTGYEFEAQPLGPTVMAGIVFYPFERARELLRFHREITREAPNELACLFAVRTAPPAPFLPAEVHGKRICGIAMSYAGPVEDAAPYVERIRSFPGEPLADLIRPQPFSAHQKFLDSGQPWGRQYYWKSDFFEVLNDEAIDRAITHWEKITSPLSSTLVMHLGGAAKDVPIEASAIGHRNAEYVMAIQAAWEDPAESEQHIAWARAFWNDLHPFSSGNGYINFQTAEESEDRIRQSYPTVIYERLAEIKQRYDPDNMFRHNKNIQPMTGRAGATTAMTGDD